ncbi:hypothetical protein MMA86_25340, partial [Salmonella enterica]|nr:hypothetical protein [Salmonella enterica]
QGVFAQQSTIGTRFSIVDRNGRLLCGEPFDANVALDTSTPVGAAIVPDRGLILSLPGLRHGPSARVFFPKAFLTQLAAPGT